MKSLGRPIVLLIVSFSEAALSPASRALAHQPIPPMEPKQMTLLTAKAQRPQATRNDSKK